LVVARGLATAIGTFGIFGIALEGVVATWRHYNDSWLGLLLIVCTGYVGIMALHGLIQSQDERVRRYVELYAVAIRLKEAGQTLQDATAHGSRGEVISAELHWYDAVTDVEALRSSR
jgi:hypothetical protein